jgi:hypothetical protein
MVPRVPASLAMVLVFAALAGALASWIVGAVSYARGLRGLAVRGDAGAASPLPWLAVVGWPFALKRLQGAAAEHAARTNKALVAFFACLLVAAAATSVATNLHRISR